MKRTLLTLPLILVFASNCKKHNDKQQNPCEGKTQPGAYFAIKEMVGDTAFTTDTVFRDNYVQFQAVGNYATVTWKIGSDPRQFNQSLFNLSFVNDLVTIPIIFTATGTPDTQCFPADSGKYVGQKMLTTVEQFDKNTLTRSPLIGKYKG